MSDDDVTYNELGQPIGPLVGDWQVPPRPPRVVLTGRFCRVEPADVARHGRDLHAANSLDREGGMWTYMAYGPFATEADYFEWLTPRQHTDDPMFFAIVDVATGRATGRHNLRRRDRTTR